uniref:Uncharacterized protein n=1 Tax=Caenorhabditis tropicalis TaxID=1561998 RepID=A0A1I7U1S2_9PELO
MTDFGFVCEDHLDKIRVFTKSRQILELPSHMDDDCLFLSDWIEISSPPVDLPHFKVWVEDGKVLVRLLVIGPNLLALPSEIAAKYEKLVWSPHLGLLRDESHVYRQNFMGDRVGEVVARYAPSGDTYFELIEAVKWLDGEPEEADKGYLKLAPWYMETIAPIKELPLSSWKTNSTQIVKVMDATGICIEHDFVNPCLSKINKTPEKCSLLWSPITGLTRWIITDQDFEDLLPRLGEWYTYRISDYRGSSSRREQQMLKREEAGEEPVEMEKTMKFFNTTASRVCKLEKLKPTQRIVREARHLNGEMIIENNIEIECTFHFKHSFLETEENGRVENWATRENGLRKDAHFYDFDLGRIEIYPKMSMFLIKEIENFEKDLKRSDPKEYERLQKQMIVVKGSVSRLNKYFANSRKYPDFGLFFLKKIHTICYYQGETVIWQA